MASSQAYPLQFGCTIARLHKDYVSCLQKDILGLYYIAKTSKATPELLCDVYCFWFVGNFRN